MSVWRLAPRQDPQLLTHLINLRRWSSSKLRPDFSRDLHPASQLPQIELAKEIFSRAVANNWPITIYGDYDADGTPGAAILALVMRRLNLPHQVILPTRQSGYGLHASIVKELPAPSLLITVDTGVTALEPIRLAKERGIETIVLDHHLPQDELPAAAIVDPHLKESTYPFKHLCGAALAYKFVEALAPDFPQLDEGWRKWLVELVAIATVADMVPLIGENRAIVHFGLMALRKTRRPGLVALLESAGLTAGELSSYHLGYVFGPRLNAAGRLKDNRPALELLLAEDQSSARELATRLEEDNRTRQDLLEETLALAERILWQQNSPEDRLLTVVGEGWSSGIVGLVAGRLVGQNNRPVLVGTRQNKLIRGSGRSSAGYDLMSGLQLAKNYWQTFGGHRQAAGWSCQDEDWPAIVQILKTDANRKLGLADLEKTHFAQAQLEEGELTLEVAKQLTELEPFGLGNPRPNFFLPEVSVINHRAIGKDNSHLKMTVINGQSTLEVIGFSQAANFQMPKTPLQLIGNLEINRWQGRDRLQFRMIDYQPYKTKIEEASDEEIRRQFCLS